MSTSWDGTLLLLCSASAAISLIVAIQFAGVLRRLAWNPDPSVGPIRHAKVSVIIPARNEEEDLEQALTSVLRQEDLDLEIFLVNDHSSDRTGEIAEKLAQSDARLKVLHDPDLRPGWLGKANAMQHAAALASGDCLIFTDADVVHAPRCFATAITEVERAGLDFFSLFPKMRCVSFWENVDVPAFVGGLVQFATSGLDDPRSPDALAAGALLLVRSEVFRAVGGFEPIRDEMFDDVSLARLLKRQGYRVRFRAAPDLLQVRLFKGNRHAFWGMTKNVLQGLNGRLWLAPVVVLLPLLVFWLPLFCFFLSLLERNWLLMGIATAAYLIPYATFRQGRNLFAFHPGKVLFYPLSAIVVSACLIRALYLYVVKGAVQWRGRTIRVRTGSSAEA